MSKRSISSSRTRQPPVAAAIMDEARGAKLARRQLPRVLPFELGVRAVARSEG